jgi:RNA polymerase sigma factor (sigma-70 family)
MNNTLKPDTPKNQSELNDLERKVADLEKRCAFFERIVHEVPANIYVSDINSGVVWCNHTNEESLGYTLEEILDMGGLAYIYKIVHPEDHNVPDSSIEHYTNFDKPEFGGVFRAKHKDHDNYKWFMGWAKSFQKDEKGKTKELLCVDVDMSPRMDTQDQLIQALRENLKQKNQLLIKSLGKREIEILNLVCKGLSTKEIAEELYISVNTVSTHRKSIQKKLGTTNVADLVSVGREAGLG